MGGVGVLICIGHRESIVSGLLSVPESAAVSGNFPCIVWCANPVFKLKQRLEAQRYTENNSYSN